MFKTRSRSGHGHGLSLARASLIGVFASTSAFAQDVPATPADPPTAPAEPAPAAPPEPTPEPPAAPPPETPAPVPTPPPAAPPPPPKDLAPSHVTLEETPDEPLPAKPASGTHKPKPHAARRATKSFEPVPAAAAKPERATPIRNDDAPTANDDAKPEGDRPRDTEPESKKDDGDGLLGPFRIGVLVGVGLPSLLSFGGMIKLTRYFGAGVNVGLIPTIKLSLYGEAKLAYQEYDLYGRLFPFGGDLFLGAGVGYASIAGSFKTSYNTAAVQSMFPGVTVPNPLFIDSQASIRTLVLTPTIGLLHVFGSGFTLGVDVGAQVPIAPSTTHYQTRVPSTLPPALVNQYVAPTDRKVKDTLDTVGRTILPTLNVKLGWLI